MSIRPPRRITHRGGRRFWAAVVALAMIGGSGTWAAGAQDLDTGGQDGPPGTHEGAEGLQLAATPGPERRGPGCPADMPRREYSIVALEVDITLNRFLDHDPQGRMFALERDLERTRAEERANALARADATAEPAVSVGLMGDAIQPLTLRVRPGECLSVRLENQLANEPATFHLHGAALRIAGTAEPAIATNPRALVPPNGTTTYEWWVAPDEPEATHYFHSHGLPRAQTSHGLFGAVIVEPPGSTWLDPRTGEEASTGWDAIVVPPEGPAFREFALYYHEIGDESFVLSDRTGQGVPIVDPILGDYRPAARALNYRSEPFMNRVELQQELLGVVDESLAYSSYTFGDPATPIARGYLGDPVKQRVIHGGSEVFHVHHVHGGSIRWRRQPGVEPSNFDAGLEKFPPLVPQATERIDSQGLGPSETFDVAHECGSGGCQQSAGDFLYHCHVAQHYFAGMWGIWRVYNTVQDGQASTDGLPPLPELPDRDDHTDPAVPSDALIGKTIAIAGVQRRLTPRSMRRWVERQLPPRGRPGDTDASVFDWQRRGSTYLGEPETDHRWPGYEPRAPGERPPLLFDPRTGLLAYPFLQPHLGRRPPFAPNHGPSPFLDPIARGPSPAPPGANGDASTCPAGTRLRTFVIHAITLPITLNQTRNIVDAGGQLFVLKEDERAVRARNDRRIPLAIRGNAQQDCIDIILKSELLDNEESNGHSKVNLHVHFAQFDVQGSDGVVTGFNYEQSVRPFRAEGVRLRAPAPAGSTELRVRGGRLRAGAVVGVGMDQENTFEVVRIAAVRGDRVTLDRPLRHDHAAGEHASAEFVRYRWYPDAQFGTAYFHDHVNALSSWRHGLFGAIVAEPPGSTYHDPRTGTRLRSGVVADIRTDGRVSVDVEGSFRELVLFIQDDNPITHLGRSTGSSINLRVEPLPGRAEDPAEAFSSRARGDPETTVLKANVGDPIVLRTLVAGANEVHTLHVDGHWFRVEPWSERSPPAATAHLGISERVDLVIPAAGGPRRLAGDYLYTSGRATKIAEGSWGLIRVHDPGGGEIRNLPGRAASAPAGTSGCPADAPERRFGVTAEHIRAPAFGEGIAYRLTDAGSTAEAPEPLVLRAAAGDCLLIELTNGLTDRSVTFHPDLLVIAPDGPGAAAIGRNRARAVPSGGRATIRLYAPPELAEGVSLIRDLAGGVEHPAAGLFAAIVVGSPGTTWLDPVTGDEISEGAQAVGRGPDGSMYRDAVLFLQDADAGIGSHRMPYTKAVRGTAAINYRAAPLQPDGTAPLYDTAREDAPPVIDTFAGEEIRVHVLSPSSEQSRVFALEGHRWPLEPGRDGTARLSAVQVGGLEAITLRLESGGDEALAGDYLYGDHREAYREAGMWGILRVRAACASAGSAGIRPLDPTSCGTAGWIIGTAGAALLVLVAIVLRARRRRLSRARAHHAQAG